MEVVSLQEEAEQANMWLDKENKTIKCKLPFISNSDYVHQKKLSEEQKLSSEMIFLFSS